MRGNFRAELLTCAFIIEVKFISITFSGDMRLTQFENTFYKESLLSQKWRAAIGFRIQGCQLLDITGCFSFR